MNQAVEIQVLAFLFRNRIKSVALRVDRFFRACWRETLRL